MKRRTRLFLFVTVTIVLSFAATAGAKTVTLPNDIAWVMSSDTYLLCVQQAYLNAINRLRGLAEGKQPGTWCVVLDADETIISNVRFQAEQAAKGEGYSRDAWNAWCGRMEATALPGAIEFLKAARELGGKIVIITNRQDPLREPTIKNLEKIGIPFDVCLLREGTYKNDRSKAARRSDIEKGTAKNLPVGMKLPPLAILMLAGDQTHDLYENKTFAEVKDRVGRDLLIIPNPMYGDWTDATFQVPSGPIRSQPPEAARSQSGETPITWREAMGKVGQTVTVEAEILSIYDPAERGRTGPVKLNTDRNWDDSLTIIFFNKDGNFGDPIRFEGQTIRARGKITVFQDSVQLTVSRPDQIEIID